MDDSFAIAIREHLELQRRNRLLEAEMPLDGYRSGPVPGPAALAEPVLEDTQEWVVPDAPDLLGHEEPSPAAEQLWSGMPAFDWGD